jgi:hypothetical protein
LDVARPQDVVVKKKIGVSDASHNEFPGKAGVALRHKVWAV